MGKNPVNPKILAILILTTATIIHANNSLDKQLKSNTDALKKTQQNIKKAEEKVRELEVKESGVLKTMAEIDKGLTQTREHLDILQKREHSLRLAINEIEGEIQVLQKSIDIQKEALAARLKNLYMHGKREEWELFFNLLKEHENPERKIYWVQRLLDSDKATIDNHLAAIAKQQEKRQLLGTRQKEMADLHESKSKEENKLQNQLIFQNEVLAKVKKDKSTQERAIEEYKRNQQTLSALITTLEKKRQAELSARKKTEEKKVATPKEAPVAVGPKCTPLKGEILSDYGYHTNKDLNIKIMHLGTEIRGQKGESIKAAAAGTVAMIANLPGHGPSVILDHKGTYYSVYGHLAEIKVKEGQEVKNCQDIGTVGNAESTNGYKLFFQVYKSTQTQDPMAWLKH
ncbi:MAG: peptidoglycan DD-metalloendopeptidase family protein [Fibromonadaceae bacterium]|jgi:septal ring factor EnvC (AmiA/AmiB activator)|nr:peptidoglycan DD-metalloendopeptidase family protein [Fibromonadaceae bacterium]